MDKSGKIIIPLKYDNAASFSDNLAGVEKNGKWGFVNKQGEEVIFLEYKNAWGFENGIARVKKHKKWFYIDKQGKCIKNCP